MNLSPKRAIQKFGLTAAKFRHALFSRRIKTRQPGQFVGFRANFVYCALFAGFMLLGVRAITIHLFPASSKSLSRIADRQYNRELSLSRYRGTIFDRRREPLAISIRTPSLFVNPRIFRPTSAEVTRLAQILRINERGVYEVLNKKKYFAWLKRKIPQDAAAQIADMKINGLYEVSEPARYYPAGYAAANLLGYVGIDDKGLVGIERQFEKPMGGAPTRIIQSKDARGNTIFFQSEDAAPERTGDNIYLTIDKAIQEISESALRQGVKNAKAVGGFAIVSDPHTGKILALANYPTFDPNNMRNVDIKVTKNKALMDSFEPGSTIKPIVAAVAMASGKVNENTMHDCEFGKIKIGKHTINDDHKPETRYLSTSDIVVHSSNVGIYKIASALGTEPTYNGLQNFGFGQKLSSLAFPGEAGGGLSYWTTWKQVRFANIAFGQGLTTTGLELVQAYGAIANGGNLMQPYYVERIESSEGHVKASPSAKILRRVMTPAIAKKIRQMLEKTVEVSAVNAKLEHYTSAGKTGTSQKIDPQTKAYSHTKHLASFAGITPAKDPHLVVYVQIDEPSQKLHYGSLWAAPVFKEISEKTLKYLNVAPDKPLTVAKAGNDANGPKRNH